MTENQEIENFKTSPLGFLMSVIAKYQAMKERSQEFEKSKNAKELLDNLKIELLKTENLKKEPSNEAILMHILEQCDKEEQTAILECVFEYLNILDGVIENIDKNSEDGKAFIDEYYDVSRLGLILNCYLGEFDDDDFFYGSLAHICETVKGNEKIEKISDSIFSSIEKADINLSFDKFLQQIFYSLQEDEKEILYVSMVKSYTENLLEKIITKAVEEDDIGRLACTKQIQRKIEKML